jgi:hypothetical protein
MINLFTRESDGMRIYLLMCMIGRLKMKKIKEMTHEQRLKWLSIARGPELLRAYHLAINNYNAKDSEKVFNYDSVREEILKRLNY